MKTLDEVIFEAPYSPTPWEADALEYLKKLKRIEAKIEKIAIGNVEDTLLKMNNSPLTWEQLRQMEGKPVWIELLNHGIWDDPSNRVDSEWWVIGEVRKDDIILATYLDEMELCEEDIGVLWNAYRKERE